MSLRILFTDVYYYTGGVLLEGPGYVYVRGGSVEAYGEGEPPEELALAEMVVSGEALAVYPGLALAVVAAELYPFRSILKGSLRVSELLNPRSCPGRILSSLSGEEAYHASLMAFYELALNGVTRALVFTLNPSETGRALVDSGLAGGLLVPYDCGYSIASKPSAPGGVKLYALSCSGAKPGWADALAKPVGDKLCFGDTCIRVDSPPIHVEPWLSPWHRIAVNAGGWEGYMVTGHKLFDESYRMLQGTAHLVSVDLSEPPGWLPSPRHAHPSTLGSRPRVETVLSEGRVVVDGGEHMILGRSHALKAAEKLKDTLERIEKVCRG